MEFGMITVDAHIAFVLPKIHASEYFRKEIKLPCIYTNSILFLSVNNRLCPFVVEDGNAGPFIFEGDKALVCTLSPVGESQAHVASAIRKTLEANGFKNVTLRDLEEDETWVHITKDEADPLLAGWYGFDPKENK